MTAGSGTARWLGMRAVAAAIVVAVVAAVMSPMRVRTLGQRAGGLTLAWSVDWLLVAASLMLLVRLRAWLPADGCHARGSAGWPAHGRSAATNADFHAADSASGSGELEAESAALPPGDGGDFGDVGLAQDR